MLGRDHIYTERPSGSWRPHGTKFTGDATTALVPGRLGKLPLPPRGTCATGGATKGLAGLGSTCRAPHGL